jgi:uncharacterized protein (TIGR03437 family)
MRVLTPETYVSEHSLKRNLPRRVCYDPNFSSRGMMRIITQCAVLFLFLSSLGFSQDAVLSLASASGAPGSSISLDLTLTSSQSSIASAQWTLNYWPVDVAAVSVVAGPSAASAGKSLYCAGGAGAIKCILAGLTIGVLGDGVVARVTVKLAPATPDAVSTIGVTGTLGASPEGETVLLQGHAAVITIPQPAHLNGIACTPPNVVTPGVTACTLTLSAPAAAGMVFNLSSANPNISVPASVSVPAGGKGANFNVTASAVNTIALAPVTATLGAQSFSTAVILAPPGGGVSMADIVNAANYANGPVAPGEIVSVLGSGIGPAQGAGLQLESGMVATRLAGARVLFDGVPAPLLYVGGDQVNTVAPYGVAGRASTQVQVEYLGALSKALTVPIAAASPGIFTRDASGAGQGAILNQDASVNSAANPAPPGSIVMIYATGEGQVSPRPVDGSITGTSVLAKPLGKVTVWIGGAQAEVLYAGAAPDLVAGMLQVNARIPTGIATGPSVPVMLAVGGFKSQAHVTLAVQ